MSPQLCVSFHMSPQLPQVLVKLTCDNPEQLERSVEKLISYGPLLDLVDTKYKSVSVALNIIN